ncbi:GNAT family N-acetyltransferase [Rhodobacteraceae bacterium NNCM2]|nr:GNAT family N-acetyltransferase [Coraliihabitans acroporae]
MAMFRAGKFRARIAETPEDVRACQHLRYLTFIEMRGVELQANPDRMDIDEFDPSCTHVMVEESKTGQLVCCFRMLPMANGSEISRSYAAKFYELSKLQEYPGKMVEMGRFCIHPAWKDANILRVAWAAMTRFVDEQQVELLFGCSSFYGVDAEAYADAFALLKERHIAPTRWLPRVKAPRVFRFKKLLKLRKPNLKLAMQGMPPLLRTYLVMGGWVSDHAVIDNDLNTLHVFTGVEIKRVPPKRAQLLRGLMT